MLCSLYEAVGDKALFGYVGLLAKAYGAPPGERETEQASCANEYGLDDFKVRYGGVCCAAVRAQEGCKPIPAKSDCVADQGQGWECYTGNANAGKLK
ncbi:hypothetical protein DSM19430T_06590 [Desulfovibrio psychrotolerans]|uniref:Uncharacterized protein n=1 Tax=Desulfovibrio psychrotolerans TaxID=415242 RepID=A0A7J0BS44_9BACT|nr:hypothetical protein DSM19430T_06590 [Desulfovibrio psychrotolerans]